MDRQLGYRARSILAVPMTSTGGAVVGVLQLINRKHTARTSISPETVENRIRSLGSFDEHLNLGLGQPGCDVCGAHPASESTGAACGFHILIFEALTAGDRPYKPAKTLSELARILAGFRDRKHIDADLFKLFLRSGVYLDFAYCYLPPEQVDKVEIEDYP